MAARMNQFLYMLFCCVIIASIFVFAQTAGAAAIIDNGTIQIGVLDEGHLNVPGGTPSSGEGTTTVGLRYLPTNAESTSPGCLCEGWGAADATSGVTGHADVDRGGVVNLTPLLFNSTASTAISIVGVGTTLEVTHNFHPSVSPDAYEVTVTVRNISVAPVELRYRRVMDWDIEPTAFAEFVTISGTAASPIITFASDNGFAVPDPLLGPSQILFAGDAVDSGPADHGGLFDMDFGTLAPGGIKIFNIYYGASANETNALAALAAVGASAFSLGQPNTIDGPTLGTPNTFFFGFGGVGVGSSDLAITKSDSPDPVAPGGTLTYTIDVTNNGPDDATGVTVVDTLPAGLTFVSATPSQGSCSEAMGVVQCNLGNLANGANATVTLEVTVDPMASGDISNTTMVSGNETDPDEGDNSATEITTVFLPIPSAEPIPTLSELARLALALMLGGFAISALRRGKRRRGFRN